MMRIGVISDTHGLLRAKAVAALEAVDHILHAGDVGADSILDTLKKIAPLTAIRGNVDTRGRCGGLPPTEIVEFGGKAFYLIHSERDLDIKPEAAGVNAVIYGHSHRPSIEERQGVLYINPGSAGPRRFTLPITLALIEIDDGRLSCVIVEVTK